MNTNKLLVLFIERMGCEITTPVLLSLLENVETFGDSIQNAKLPQSLKNILSQYENLNNVIMIGTYWNDGLQLASESFPSVKFFVIANGESKTTLPNVKVFNTQETQIGPVQTSLNIVDSLGLATKSFKAYLATNQDIIRLSDDRIFNRNIEENQYFYSGLFADPKLSGSLKERLEQLVNGISNMTDVLRFGKIAFGVQLGMAQERAIQNSMVFQFTQKGETKTAVITNAPELVNLTHDQLFRHNDSVDYTVTTALRFHNGVKLQYSFRSQQDGSDAQMIAQHMGGDGSKISAGATIPFEIPLNFESWKQH
jgi:hypothetical protein